MYFGDVEISSYFQPSFQNDVKTENKKSLSQIDEEINSLITERAGLIVKKYDSTCIKELSKETDLVSSDADNEIQSNSAKITALIKQSTELLSSDIAQLNAPTSLDQKNVVYKPIVLKSLWEMQDEFSKLIKIHTHLMTERQTQLAFTFDGWFIGPTNIFETIKRKLEKIESVIHLNYKKIVSLTTIFNKEINNVYT